MIGGPNHNKRPKNRTNKKTNEFNKWANTETTIPNKSINEHK